MRFWRRCGKTYRALAYSATLSLGTVFLARPTDESASPLPVVLQALEARVLNKTGVAVSIGGKTLRGEPADSWPVSRCAQTSPGRGHQLPQPWTGKVNGGGAGAGQTRGKEEKKKKKRKGKGNSKPNLSLSLALLSVFVLFCCCFSLTSMQFVHLVPTQPRTRPNFRFSAFVFSGLLPMPLFSFHRTIFLKQARARGAGTAAH